MAVVAFVAAAVRDVEQLLGCNTDEASPGPAGLGGSALGAGHNVLGTGIIDHRFSTWPGASSREMGVARSSAILLCALATFGLTIAASLFEFGCRRFRQYACDVPAQLALKGDVIAARISSISRTGAKLRAPNEACRGLRGAVGLPGGERVKVKVVWANAGFLGVSFSPSLPNAPKGLIHVAPAAA